MSLCTEKALSDMMAEDMHKIKTQPMNHGAIVSLVMEIKNMDLFRQRLEISRVLAELEPIP